MAFKWFWCLRIVLCTSSSYIQQVVLTCDEWETLSCHFQLDDSQWRTFALSPQEASPSFLELEMFWIFINDFPFGIIKFSIFLVFETA